VSLFVFWSFFLQNNSIFERANKNAANNHMKEATLRSANWLEAKGYPKDVVEWMKSAGLEKNISIPVAPNK